jgi:hypothetical protein
LDRWFHSRHYHRIHAALRAGCQYLHRRHDAVFLDENSLRVKRAVRCRDCRYDNLLSRGKVGAVGWDECHDGHIGGHVHRIAAALVRKLQDVAARRLHNEIDIRVRRRPVRPKVKRAVSFPGASCGFVEHVSSVAVIFPSTPVVAAVPTKEPGLMSESLIFLTALIVRFEGSVTETVSPLLRWMTSMSPFSERMSADAGDLGRGNLGQRCGACECHGGDGTADCRAVGHWFPMFAFCMSGLNCVTREVTRLARRSLTSLCCSRRRAVPIYLFSVPPSHVPNDRVAWKQSCRNFDGK